MLSEGDKELFIRKPPNVAWVFGGKSAARCEEIFFWQGSDLCYILGLYWMALDCDVHHNLAMDSRIRVIGQLQLFSGLPPGHIEKIAACGTFIRIAKKTVLMEQGAPGRSMIVLIRGRVKIEQGPALSQLSTVAYREAGDAVGEMSLLDDEPRSARVTAVTDCQAIQIRKEDFRRVVQENPQICFELLKVTMQRLREATEELTTSRIESIEAKIVRLLERLPADETGVLSLNQTQLAKQVGCSREALNRNLHTVVESGKLVRIGRGKYRLAS